MWVLYLHYCKVWTHPNNTVFLNHKFKYVCAAVSGLFFHYAHESKEKVFFRKSQYRLLAKYLQHSVRDSLYHWNKYQKVLIIIFATQSSDVSNTILSIIKQTQTSFFEHRTNSNMFIYWRSNLNTLFLALNDHTSNFEHSLTHH